MSGESRDLRRWRLPRGRHGLPRELVERSQRERLLAAMVRVCASKGYEATSVADVLTVAGVGRESFYELFADRRDCMLAARALLLDDLATRVEGAYGGAAPWPDRVRTGLAAALDWFAEDTAAGRVVMLELAPLGTISRRLFREDFERFTRLLENGIEPAAPPPQASGAARLAVGAVFARIYDELVSGRAEQLPEALPDLTYEVLVPFVGEAAARQSAS